MIVLGMFVFSNLVSALTANSSNYSVGMFGTGMLAANLSSANYIATSLSEAKGTTRNAENDIHTANIGFWGNTSYHRTVSIASWSISSTSAVQGSIIGLSISALNSESVWVVLTLPNTTQETIGLVNNGPVYAYTANAIGKYTITFWANNSQGNKASVNLIDIFEITSLVIPSTTPPPSGGGTTTIIEKCVYIWDCTSWSICSNKIQKRECKNIGNCTGIQGKPIETRECLDALFDVIIGLKEPVLTKNDTLKFNISLTETKGIEKIDVYIKYSIIDSENNEIFSQIETRAIQGNLSFEKEINEIKLKDGEYTLRVNIVYNNLQRAFAEQTFKIKGKEIEIKEQISNIQKINEFIKFNYKIIVLVILVLIVLVILVLIVLVILVIKKRKSKKEKLKVISLESKLKPFENIIVGEDKYLEIKPKPEQKPETKPIEDIKTKIKDKKNILLELKWFLISLLRKFKKHSKNSILGLINKKVYSESGLYIGKIKDIILGENKIESLKIKIDKKHNFKAKGIVIGYRQVKSVGEVIIISEKVLEYIENI
jgi:sporulation protein YlmC with PRC-barrel domain